VQPAENPDRIAQARRREAARRRFAARARRADPRRIALVVLGIACAAFVALAFELPAVATAASAIGDAAADVPTSTAGAADAAQSGFGAWLESVVERLRGAPPILFYGALVIATMLPFPVGLFYLVAGAVYGIVPALCWIAGSLVVSNLIIHTASKSFLRPALEALVARRGHRIPRFESGLDEALFIALVRITPGVPYFLQNVVLAVAHLDLMRFLVLSVALQMIYVTGFVVLGRSALDGELGWAVGALAVLVALMVGARVVAKRRGKRDPIA